MSNFKYPVSKNNYQCIGGCYKAGTWILHPNDLIPVTDNKNTFCPVLENIKVPDYTDTKNTYKYIRILTDPCIETINNEDQIDKINFILYPKIDFDDEVFLNIYYKISSMEDALKWIQKNSPFKTKLRIINSSINSYKKKIYIIDVRFVNFIKEYINIKFSKLYNNLYKYLCYSKNKNKIKICKYNENENIDNYKNEKEKFIKDNFISESDITEFLTVIIITKKNDLTNEDNNVKKFFNIIISFIKKKIKNTYKYI